MAMPTRIGLSLPVPGNLEATLTQAEWAEQNGFDGIWFADSGDLDALTLAKVPSPLLR